jgi:hypothetical protein
VFRLRRLGCFGACLRLLCAHISVNRKKVPSPVKRTAPHPQTGV